MHHGREFTQVGIPRRLDHSVNSLTPIVVRHTDDPDAGDLGSAASISAE